jgi:branched-chain amino acid transport system ATP-binding protein
MKFLETKGLTKAFGGLVAVDDLNLAVDKGEIVGVIGPNGAGKTTVFNLISGMLPCTRGKTYFNGETITGMSMHQIAERGLARTFQLPRLFGNFTVRRNMLMGLHLSAETGFWKCLFNSSKTKASESKLAARADEILEEVGLGGRKEELAYNLPHGLAKTLQVALSLGCNPALLLLDEPMTGMNMEEVQEMALLIRRLRDSRNVTFIIVEHNVRAVMGLSDRVAVLNFGKKIAEGRPSEIAQNGEVIRAYLGGTDDVA